MMLVVFCSLLFRSWVLGGFCGYSSVWCRFGGDSWGGRLRFDVFFDWFGGW